MSNQTLLIILIVLFLVFGGGGYYTAPIAPHNRELDRGWGLSGLLGALALIVLAALVVRHL